MATPSASRAIKLFGTAVPEPKSRRLTAGPLSVELFLPKFQKGNPYEIAREIRQKCETVMSKAGVL